MALSRSKQLVLSLSGIALGGLLFVYASLPKAVLRPQLAVERIRPGGTDTRESPAEAAIRLQIRNHGTGHLRIYEVRSGCGVRLFWEDCGPCSLPLDLAPNQAVSLRVLLQGDPAALRTPPTLTFYTNDPESPALTVDL
ncbi:MAG: hypothetical protein KatS3mg077_1373 [Candidatus Binatia bacterium]|nr:MAG: hypothetical protein KatS3mg077_1373 [Candidatus Binatia bacterium]